MYPLTPALRPKVYTHLFVPAKELRQGGVGFRIGGKPREKFLNCWTRRVEIIIIISLELKQITTSRSRGMRTGIPERLCGRPFSLNDLQAIKEEVKGGYSLSRMEIARRVCNRLNWGQFVRAATINELSGRAFTVAPFRLYRITTASDEEWKRQRAGPAKDKASPAKLFGGRPPKPHGIAFG